MIDVPKPLGDQRRRPLGLPVSQSFVSPLGGRSRLRLRAALAAGALSLAACASQSAGPIGVAPPEPAAGSATFRLQDFSWSKAVGPAAIAGVLEYQANRVSFTCQGRDVVLLPETGWSRMRVMTLYGSLESAAVPVEVVRSRTIAAPADYALVVRHATCDQASRFGFQNLPAGRWFVITLASPLQGRASALVMMRRVETRRSLQQIILAKQGP